MKHSVQMTIPTLRINFGYIFNMMFPRSNLISYLLTRKNGKKKLKNCILRSLVPWIR